MGNRRRPKNVEASAPLGLNGGKYNGYKCKKCGGVFLTVDIDVGTTPAAMRCFATQGCDGQAISMGYPLGSPPENLPLMIEWYMPKSPREIAKLRSALQEMVFKGGLVRRAAPGAPDWVREIA